MILAPEEQYRLSDHALEFPRRFAACHLAELEFDRDLILRRIDIFGTSFRCVPDEDVQRMGQPPRVYVCPSLTLLTEFPLGLELF